MNIRPAGDGHRVVTDCAGGCGADVVCLPAYVGRARCITCGRTLHGAAVPQRPAPGETRRNGLALGQPGASMPGRLEPDRLSRTAETTSAPAVRKGLVEEWSLADARLPAGPRGFVEDLARAGIMGARVCHTVALKPDGQLSETIGVHWAGGRAFWTRSDHPASVTRRKVDLKRTKTGRRKIQRFDPIITPARTVWTGEVYAPMRMTVTQAILAIRQRTGT